MSIFTGQLFPGDVLRMRAWEHHENSEDNETSIHLKYGMPKQRKGSKKVALFMYLGEEPMSRPRDLDCTRVLNHLGYYEREEPKDLWTPEQVDKLNEFQRSGVMHPFTCPSHSQKEPLVATVHGWRCVYCDYTQDWAHEFMFAGAPMNQLDIIRNGGPNSE